MSKLEKLRLEIELARKRLHHLAEVKGGNLIDHEVAAGSVELDRLIVDYEREKNARFRGDEMN